MKNKIIAIFIFFISISFYWGQDWKPEDQYEKLFFIEDFAKSKNHRVSKYTLNTKELYGIDKKIEINNVLIKNYKGEDWGILLITALPDLKGQNDWVKVKYDSIKDKIVTSPKVKNISFKNSTNSNEEYVMKTLRYGIVKKIGNDYFIPYHCITEYFRIRTYEYPLTTSNVIININEKPVTIKEMSNFYKINFSRDKDPFPLDMSNPVFELVGIDSDLVRYYHSKNYKIKNEDAYQFWTMNAWLVRDGYNTQRGIDRFVYIPKKGIIGGSYDFYFRFNNGGDPVVPFKKFWDNIINEKVMIAEELK
ncbi:hypothetical protein M2T78_15480 [Elizabethkingia ursingii]|uniref:hypothetical protein n=1 Tax=Elizabethkingia ursingii TaxID=1756150 RepID=UPI0020138457|nr:hypothetical protein [Elizabethkingia ursingii]MCL1665667.1 hypothetical protein [Elizabethkingia ursingii]